MIGINGKKHRDCEECGRPVVDDAGDRCIVCRDDGPRAAEARTDPTTQPCFPVDAGPYSRGPYHRKRRMQETDK